MRGRWNFSLIHDSALLDRAQLPIDVIILIRGLQYVTFLFFSKSKGLVMSLSKLGGFGLENRRLDLKIGAKSSGIEPVDPPQQRCIKTSWHGGRPSWSASTKGVFYVSSSLNRYLKKKTLIAS